MENSLPSRTVLLPGGSSRRAPPGPTRIKKVERLTIKRDATIKEIAHLAGVGVATVDRVLHGRPNVRPEKVDRVLKAIQHLNGERDRRMVNGHASAMRVALVAHS